VAINTPVGKLEEEVEDEEEPAVPILFTATRAYATFEIVFRTFVTLSADMSSLYWAASCRYLKVCHYR
jgi:hypothetical protein